jgi:hypothetical protein
MILDAKSRCRWRSRWVAQDERCSSPSLHQLHRNGFYLPQLLQSQCPAQHFDLQVQLLPAQMKLVRLRCLDGLMLHLYLNGLFGNVSTNERTYWPRLPLRIRASQVLSYTSDDGLAVFSAAHPSGSPTVGLFAFLSRWKPEVPVAVTPTPPQPGCWVSLAARYVV